MEVVYRECTERDAEMLLAYTNRVGAETDYLSFGKDEFLVPVERERSFIRRFQNNKKDLMLVATLDGLIVANASIESSRISRFAHQGELSVTVLKKFWGQGIATRLIEMLLEHSKENGITDVTLFVRSDNERAISLYEKCGFVKIGTHKNYFKINGKYYDADFMQKLLV
ncbi:MAG: GNAT family N-acetyltransferase [Clostridia bacterium]|nr:GNAT family N-acetyltransferase [Clostridia bacterium]